MPTDVKTGERYPWRHQEQSSLIQRPLSGIESLFTILNDSFYGQNCPFIGAKINVKNPKCQNPGLFSVSDLQERSELAFQKTRWTYPAVGCQVSNKQMSYNVKSAAEIKAWSKRTVKVVINDGGWLELREELSMKVSLPSKDGDCCFVYIVYPKEAQRCGVTTFDVLIHIHHALTDGAGIRSILNEFLEHMVSSTLSHPICWGQEVDRLFPAAIDLSTKAEREAASEDVEQQQLDIFMSGLFSVSIIPPSGQYNLNWLLQPDIGLPLYRPDILDVKAENRGSSVLIHTFEDEKFLPALLKACRQHSNKLTGVLQAALFQAVYEIAEIKPDSAKKYTCLAATDLRNNGRMIPPFNERNKYVSVCVASKIIDVSCSLLEDNKDDQGFWRLAAHIGAQYFQFSQSKGLAFTSDNVIQRALEEVKKFRYFQVRFHITYKRYSNNFTTEVGYKTALLDHKRHPITFLILQGRTNFEAHTSSRERMALNLSWSLIRYRQTRTWRRRKYSFKWQQLHLCFLFT